MRFYSFGVLANPGEEAILSVGGFLLRSEITGVEIRMKRGADGALRQVVYYHFTTRHPDTGAIIDGKVSKKGFIKKTQPQKA